MYVGGFVYPSHLVSFLFGIVITTSCFIFKRFLKYYLLYTHSSLHFVTFMFCRKECLRLICKMCPHITTDMLQEICEGGDYQRSFPDQISEVLTLTLEKEVYN